MHEVSSIDTVICLVGAERSGTTLLRLMLDHHPEIAFQKEFEYAVEKISEDGQFPDTIDYINWLKTKRGFHRDSFEITSTDNYKNLLNSFLEQKRKRDRKQYVGATIHNNFDKIEYLWPDAKYIYILRDGRDVARSVIKMGWAGNMWTACQRWIDAEQLWDCVKKELNPMQWMEVRFEQLIESTEQTLTKICDFIGVDFSDHMYDYIRISSYSKPNTKLINQWKSKLTTDQVRLAEARLANLLLKRQYELSGYPLKSIGKFNQYILNKQDWAYRLFFRFKKIGIPLVFLDFLARKLCIQQLSDYTRKRIHLIINKNLKK